MRFSTVFLDFLSLYYHAFTASVYLNVVTFFTILDDYNKVTENLKIWLKNTFPGQNNSTKMTVVV